jgi:GNAT superfamily N-acetyltransferase
MDEEEQAWLAELGWDYAPVRRILDSFISQSLLPGFAAAVAGRLVAYSYFLIHGDKGIVGSLYASASPSAQETAEELLTRTILDLKGSAVLRRIEAQIIPFHHLNYTSVFTRYGFAFYPRYFLELDLSSYRWRARPRSHGTPERLETAEAGRAAPSLVAWEAHHLPAAADVVLRGYRNETDASICEDYCTAVGCENYLRSLVENPGCGVFLPDASFMALDLLGAPCGLVLASRISPRNAMIPQISVTPEQQGAGLGSALVDRSFARLEALGYRTVSLTVTKKNRRAFEWYQRLGFRVKKEFGAYVWQRS